MKTKKRTPTIIKNMAAALLKKDKNISASTLKKEIEKALKKEGEKYNFTIRTYSNIKRAIYRNILTDNPLDEQWSIADCERYNIPDNMIPIIIEKIHYDARYYDERIEIEDQPMTIRVARWMSRLKPTVDILIEKFKNDGLDIEGRIDNASPEEIIRQKDSCLYWSLYNISQVYSKLEGMSEVLGYNRFDSTVADEYFFMKNYKNWGEFDDDIELADLELPPKLRDKTENINTDREKQKSKAKKTGAEG